MAAFRPVDKCCPIADQLGGLCAGGGERQGLFLPRGRLSASRIASAISRLERRRCRLCRWMVR